jgi:hypothetical protein
MKSIVNSFLILTTIHLLEKKISAAKKIIEISGTRLMKSLKEALYFLKTKKMN